MSKKDDPIWQRDRRQCEQFLNATVIRFRTAVAADNADLAYRASTDLAQVVDNMLELVGLDPLTGYEPEDSCPDCGQLYPDALDILTEGEGE